MIRRSNLVTVVIVPGNGLSGTSALRDGGSLKDDSLLQYLSPMAGREHINLTGDYIWRQNWKVNEQFRPLRNHLKKTSELA